MKEKLKNILGNLIGAIIFEILLFLALVLSLMALGYLGDIQLLKENAFYITIAIYVAIYSLFK